MFKSGFGPNRCFRINRGDMLSHYSIRDKVIKAAEDGKKLFVVFHPAYDNSAISAYGMGIKLNATLSAYRTKKPAFNAMHSSNGDSRFHVPPQAVSRVEEFSIEEVKIAFEAFKGA